MKDEKHYVHHWEIDTPIPNFDCVRQWRESKSELSVFDKCQRSKRVSFHLYPSFSWGDRDAERDYDNETSYDLFGHEDQYMPIEDAVDDRWLPEPGTENHFGRRFVEQVLTWNELKFLEEELEGEYEEIPQPYRRQQRKRRASGVDRSVPEYPKPILQLRQAIRGRDLRRK